MGNTLRKLGSLNVLDIGAFNGTDIGLLEGQTGGTTYYKFGGFLLSA